MELQVPTKGSVVIVFGASRGIGAEIAKTFGRSIIIDSCSCFYSIHIGGYHVCVASKSTQHSEKLPGTIYSVAKEVHFHPQHVLIELDCR
jgi:hypothetical protein